MKYIIKPAASLFIAAAITVAALSFVYNKTYEAIEKQKSKAQEKAMRELLPKADNFNEIQIEGTGSITAVYEGRSGNANSDNGGLIGYVIKLSPEGYSGEIDFLAGISADEKQITGIRILRHSETPGLGALAVKEEFFGQFAKRALTPLTVTRTAPGKDEIQAITSATITSRAITNAVNEALEWYWVIQSRSAIEEFIEDDQDDVNIDFFDVIVF
jgi:electron transport complex protein RnfG